MRQECVILDSMEQSIIYKALKESNLMEKLAYKVLHGTSIPSNNRYTYIAWWQEN